MVINFFPNLNVLHKIKKQISAMNKNPVLIFAAILLLLLAGYLIYLGNKASLLPPKLTGVGFIIIAIAFIGLSGKSK
jgi:hypothetical protein